MKYFNYNSLTKDYAISDCSYNENPNWISKELTYSEDQHHHCLIAIADNEILEFDIADKDPMVFAAVYEMGLNKYLSLHGEKACTQKEDIGNIIDFLTYYNGRTDYECVYQIRNQGASFFPDGHDDYSVIKEVIFDKNWEKQSIKLFGKIVMFYDENYDVERPYYDLQLLLDDEKIDGYEFLGEFNVFSDRFNVSSLVSENNEILSTAIIEPDIVSGFNATPKIDAERIGRSYYWECIKRNGEWEITDYNEAPYVIG